MCKRHQWQWHPQTAPYPTDVVWLAFEIPGEFLGWCFEIFRCILSPPPSPLPLGTGDQSHSFHRPTYLSGDTLLAGIHLTEWKLSLQGQMAADSVKQDHVWKMLSQRGGHLVPSSSVSFDLSLPQFPQFDSFFPSSNSSPYPTFNSPIPLCPFGPGAQLHFLTVCTGESRQWLPPQGPRKTSGHIVCK